MEGDSRESPYWTVGGRHLPKSLIVYSMQIILIYIVAIFSIYNLSVSSHSHDSKLWVGFLASSIGYLLPNPRLKLSHQE